MKEDLLVPLVGVLAAALITGVISLVLAILAKDQKTSEFRQAWIDSLRNDFSELIGHLQAILDFAEDQEHAETMLREKHAEFIRMEVCVTRIRLRLNPDEHQRILRLLDELHDDNDDSLEQIGERLKPLVTEVQVVLKAEWSRVKHGETSYRALKWVSVALVLLAAGALSYWRVGMGVLASL